MKKLVLGLMLGAVENSSTIIPVNAATTGSVSVGYEADSISENPDENWYVSLPKDVNFTDNVTTANMNVGLHSYKGNFFSDFTVDVTVESANTYKLNGQNGAFDYTLEYDGRTMSGSEKEVGELSATTNTSSDELTGTAELDVSSGPHAADGKYTDTLTYTITKK